MTRVDDRARFKVVGCKPTGNAVAGSNPAQLNFSALFVLKK